MHSLTVVRRDSLVDVVFRSTGSDGVHENHTDVMAVHMHVKRHLKRSAVREIGSGDDSVVSGLSGRGFKVNVIT